MIGGGVLDRGYTGHEHLFGAGLIHMNGRLYDPVLHRFTMPDNFVQDPFSTLSYNRYSYVMNNPLMYTDFSGEQSDGGDEKLLKFIGKALVFSLIWGKVLHDYYKQRKEEKAQAASAPEPPTPSGGQVSSEYIASSLGPDTGQIYNLDDPWGILWQGYKDGYNGYYSNLWGGVKSLFTNPMGIVEREMNMSFSERLERGITGTLDMMIPGIATNMKTQAAFTRAAALGDVYQMGYIHGDRGGAMSFEVGSLALGGVGKWFKTVGSAARTGRAGVGSLKNISGSLDDAARLARNQPYGPNTNIFRRLPRSAQDVQALKGAQSGLGRNLNIRLGDPRYQGWEKWHYSVGPKGGKSVVHYLRNPKTGFLTDFKFK